MLLKRLQLCKNLHLLILIVLLSCTNSSLKAQLYFPPIGSDVWDTVSPQSIGWCEDQIQPLYNYLDSNNTKAFIVLKDGKIVIEKYFGTFTRDSSWYWASAGKTLTAFCIGIANQEGKLKLDDTTSKFLGKGWTSMTQAQEGKVTIRHQLTMTSGMIDTGVFFDCTSKACLKYKADAGSRWAYHNSPYTLLDSVLESATGTDLNAFVNTKIKNSTGMTGFFFKSGFNNVFYSTPRSMARFGLLLLNKGKWQTQLILDDSNYFKSMISSSQSLNPSYGYLTWLNGRSSYMLPGLQQVFTGFLCPDAPDDMYAALGKNGQFIDVVPSQKLVFIRMGNAPSTVNVPVDLNNEIWKRLHKIICTTTNINSTDMTPAITLYPNPVKEILNIENFVKNTSCSILDILGREIISKTLITEGKIDVSQLQSGVYYLILQNQTQEIKRFNWIKE